MGSSQRQIVSVVFVIPTTLAPFTSHSSSRRLRYNSVTVTATQTPSPHGRRGFSIAGVIDSRAGWVRRGVKEPESISHHIPGIDRDKCMKMAIVHDIAEAIVGDITPADGISKDEMRRREREALDHMCKLLGGGSRAKEIGELWMEYEENSSPEAKIVKDFDKVEMILQALEYETGETIFKHFDNNLDSALVKKNRKY